LRVSLNRNGQPRLRVERMMVGFLLALGSKVDVNRLSKAELARLPGISRPVAERIVKERQRCGGYRHLEELLKVKGVGPKTLKKVRPHLTVGSVGYGNH